MSFSRPSRFPLLKLPWLCIECVSRNSDAFDIIFFALISKRTRQFVKHFKISLNVVEIYVSDFKWIKLNGRVKRWEFRNISGSLLHEQQRNSSEFPLVLQKNAIPLYTSETYSSLVSYFDGEGLVALAMAMEFLNEVFKCSVETVRIEDDNFPESGDIGVSSTVNLVIDHAYGHARNQKLNLLLENLEVTGTCEFWVKNTGKDFYVDPKLFKCKELIFFFGSGAWVTREILLQFEVPRLTFRGCPFSVEDIASFVTQWFHSDNKKLEYLYFYIHDTQLSLENFQTEELNPVPFSERTRVPLSESFKGIDFSKGLKIVRHDGLVATIYVGKENFMFYIWHNQ